MANNRRRTKPTSIDYSQFPSGYEEGLQRLAAERAKSRFTDFTQISSRIDPVYDEIEFEYENQNINDSLDGSPAKPFANIGGRTARVKGETNPRFVYFPELADDGTPKKDGKYRNTNMHIRITDNAVYLPSIGAYVNKDSNGNAFVLGNDGTPKTPLRDVKMYIPMSEVNMLSKLKSGGVEDARPDLVKIPEPVDPNYDENFFLGAGKALAGGAQHLYYSGKAFTGALTGDTDMVLEAQEGMSKIMTSQEQRRLQEDVARRLGSEEYQKGLGFWGGMYNGIKAWSAQVIENPNGLFDTILGMTPMAVGLGAAAVGTTAATVATGGGALAVGAAQVATMYGANSILMGGAKAIEAASDGSYNKEEGYSAVKKGAIKALPYVGVDLLTMGLTSKVLSMPARAMERAAFANLVKNGVNPSEIEAGLTTVRQSVLARHAAEGTANRAIIQADMETSIANYLGQSGLSKPQLVESTQEAMKLALNNSNKIMSKLPRAAIKYGSTSLLMGAGEYAGELAAEGHANPAIAVEVAFTGLGMTVAHVKLAERFDRIRKGSTEALAPNFNNELAARIYYGRMEQVAPLTPLARPAGSEEARRATTSTETGVPVGEMPAGRSPESVPRVDTEPPTITVSVDNSGIPVIRGLGNESFQESLNRANVLSYRILQEDRLARQIQSEAGGKPMTAQQELLYNDHIRRRDYLSEQLKPINEMLIANNPEPYKGDRLDAESTRAYVEEKQKLIDTRYAEIEKNKESVLKGRDETDPSLTPDEVKQIQRLNVEEGFVDADSQALRQIHEDVIESIRQEPSPKVPRIQPEAKSLAINKLNETFFRQGVAGEEGKPLFVRAATQSEVEQSIPNNKFVSAIGDALGVDVVYTRGGKGIYEGLYAPDAKKVVFLDVDANGKTPALNILFHEFAHSLEKSPETRKAYEKIKSLIFEKDSKGNFVHISEDAYNKFVEKTTLIEQNARGIDREQALRISEAEVISEILGSASNTEAFVKSLSQKDAQRFKGMVTEFIEYINNVVSKIKERYGKTEGELMTKDLDALATKLAEIIAEIPPDGGRPTTEIQRLSYKRPEEVVKSEKFMKWFEGSKVVDEKTGLPMVMYHGTRSAFENFSLDIRPTHGASYGYGLYFTSDPRQAGAFAGEQGGNIIPTYLNIKNPLEIDGFDYGLYTAAKAEGKPVGIGKAMAEGKINDNFIKQYALERFIQDKGFPVEITKNGVSKYEKSEIDRVTKIFNDRLNDPEYGYELIQEAKNEITNMINHIPYMDGEAERRIYAAGGFDGIHVRFPNKTNWFIALDPNQVSNEITGKIMSKDAEGGALFFKRPDAEENARKELSDKLSLSHQLVIGRSPESIPDSVIQNIEPMRVKNALPESKERADALLTGFMREALEASGITNEKVISRLTSSDIVNSDIVKKAMELPQNVGRYWYENSARAFKNILELSYDDMKTFFRVLSATSGGLKPFQNTKLALASVSQWLNNTPVTIGLRDVKSLGKAFVSQGLTSLKFGNFAETLLRLSGLSKDNAIASVVDVQINAMAGNGSQSSPSPEIYEAISRYLLKLRDHINEQMAKEQGVSVSELKEPLEHYQLQAMLWVEYRAEKEGTSSLSSKEGKYDDYASVIPTIIKELKVNKIPLENGKITRKTLGKDLVNYVQLKAESTKGMTVTAEVGTKLTEVGKEVESTSTRVKKNLPEDQVRESVAEREKILSSTLSDLITKASGKDTKFKGTSPISRLLTHIVGDDSAEFTRAMLGKGSFEGEDGKIGVNPNLRFPLSDLITKFARFDKKGNRIRREGGGYETRAVDSNEILALLAELGKPFRQESNAASMFADRGTLDRAFYLAEKKRLAKIASITVDDAFTIYVKGGLEKPSTELIESLATEIGLPINYSESAGGHMFDIHPLEWLKDRNNIENVKAAVDKLGLDANIIERDYVGFYLEEKHYDAAIEQQQDIIRSRYESAERGSSQEKAFGRVGVYSQAVSPKPEEAVRTNLFTDPLADIRTNKLEPALKKWSDRWSEKVEKAEKGEVSYKRAEETKKDTDAMARMEEIKTALRNSPELRRPDQTPDLSKMPEGTDKDLAGHCYVGAQAMWYALGADSIKLEDGKNRYMPQTAKDKSGISHWWVLDRQTDKIYDPTADQYTKKELKGIYENGVNKGFQHLREGSRGPDSRTSELLNKVEKPEEGVSYKRAEDEGPKSPTVNRIPELEEAIKQRKAGNLTQEQYNQKVRELAPVELFDSVPEIAPYERIREVVNKAQAEKVESPIGENGKPLRTRVDIPSYVRSGTHVVSVHDSKNNAVISYEPFIALDGPITFGIDKEASSKIGAGEKAKYPMAFIDGKYKALSKDQIESMAKDAMSKPDEWRQVGVDPRRHGYAYDRETQDPITGAKEVIQIGGLVLAKDVTYATPAERELLVYKRTERPTQRFVIDKKELIYHYSDAFIDIKDRVKKSGQRLSYENDPAANLVQSPARARTQNRKFREDFARALYNAIKNNGVTQKELSEFLHYDHATERNIQIQSVGRKSNRLEDGGSGLTEKEIRKYFNSLTEEKRNALSKAAKEIRKFDEETLELKYRYGLITDVDYANIKRAYKKHVPLMRIMPDGEIRNLRANKARMGTETTTQRAKGSLLDVSDVINNIMADREYAINQIEKNKIAKSVWNFLNLEAKRGVDTTDFGVAIDPYSMTNADKAKMVTLLDKYGLTESEISSVLSAIESEAIDARDAVPFRRPSGILQSSNILFVRDGNKFKYVVLNGVSEEAKRFGQQLKILQPTDPSKFVDKMNSLTRAFTGLNTTNDPTFPVRNFVLDSTGMVLNLSDTPLKNKVGAVYSNMPNAVKEIWQYSMNKSKKKTGTKLTEVQKLYEELMEFGGTHHWNEILETAEKRSQYLAEEIKALERGENLSIVEFLKAVHEANQDSSENAGRLSVYMEMRKLGYTQQESAKVAKEISIDFDTSGATTRKANKLYAFLSASVGGQSRTLRAIGSTRGKQIVSGLVGLGVLQAFMLAATGLDDEIPEWEQRNNFIIPTGGKTYMKIKVRGLAPFLNIGRVSTQLATGDVINTSEKVGGLFSSFRDMLDPFGQTGSFLQTITPTIFRPVVSVLENKNWTGEKLYNEKFTNEDVNPAYARAKRKTTAASVALSEFLNNYSGGSPYSSGLIDIPPEVFDSIVSSYGGGYGRIASQIKRTAEEKRATNLPVIRELAGAGKPEQMNTTYYYNIREEINRLDKMKSGYEEDRDTRGLARFKRENPQYKFIEEFKSDIKVIRDLEKKARESRSDEEKKQKEKKVDELKAKLVAKYRKRML